MNSLFFGSDSETRNEQCDMYTVPQLLTTRCDPLTKLFRLPPSIYANANVCQCASVAQAVTEAASIRVCVMLEFERKKKTRNKKHWHTVSHSFVFGFLVFGPDSYFPRTDNVFRQKFSLKIYCMPNVWERFFFLSYLFFVNGIKSIWKHIFAFLLFRHKLK